MKKNLFICFTLLFAVNLFTSCKDDDKPQTPDVNLASGIAGTYKGNLLITVDGIDAGSSKQYIYITEENSTSVKLELKNFIFGPITVGDIVVPGIKLTDATNSITLQETSIEIQHALLKKLQIKVMGSIGNGKANISIKVFAAEVGEGQNIDVAFEGSLQSENLAAAIAGTYVGEFKYEKINATTEYTPYNQTFTITAIDENLVKMDMSNVLGLNKTLDSLEITQSGSTVTLSATKDLMVNSNLMNIEQLEISGVRTKNVGPQTKAVKMVIRTSFKETNNQFSDQYRISTIAKAIEKANEAFVNGITWTADPAEIIIGDPKIVNTKDGLNTKEEKYYGMMKYSGTFTFYTIPGSTTEQLKQLVGTFLTTDGATYTVRTLNDAMNGWEEKADFSKEPFLCTVMAKDSLSYTEYSVTRANGSALNKAKKYSFSSLDWNKMDKGNANLNYYEPKDWATSNGGIYSIKSMLSGYYSQDKPYVVTQGAKTEAVGGTGLCAKLQTVMTNEPGTGKLVPKVTAGSLFLGTFETNMNDVLASTNFGIIYKGTKLTQVTGKYKYTPGTEFWNNMEKDNSGKQDKGSATAVLYEVNSYAETLNGHDVYNSSKIIAISQFVCEPQTEYADFTLDMTYSKPFDTSKKYKLAVIFSSSKEGDKYFGAVGSTLWIDEVSIIME